MSRQNVKTYENKHDGEINASSGQETSSLSIFELLRDQVLHTLFLLRGEVLLDCERAISLTFKNLHAPALFRHPLLSVLFFHSFYAPVLSPCQPLLSSGLKFRGLSRYTAGTD